MSDLIDEIEGKNIAVTMPKAGLGGVDYYTKGLIENLEEERFNVTKIEFPEAYSRLLSGTINSSYFLAKEIKSAAKNNDSIILSDYSHAMGFSPIKIDAKVFTTVHHIHDPSNLLQKAVHRVTIRRLKQTDQMISASEHTQKALEDQFGLDSIVYDQGVKDFPEGELPEGVEKPYILYVGNHRPRKNIPLIIETFAKVAEENEEITLVLAGNHRGSEEAERIIEEKGLENRVKITGRVSEEELGALYRDAELYFHTASKEGYSRTVREARKKETPIIAVQNPLMDKIIGKENTYPPKAEKLADAIKDVIK